MIRIRKLLDSVKSVPRRVALPLVLLLAVFCWAYWPTFAAMNHRWFHEPEYAHGYLVPLFSLYLLWQRRAFLGAVQPQYNWWGVAPVLVGAALRVTGAYLYSDWLDAASIAPCLAGFCVLLGGRAALRWAWPAIAFLFFMIPLPFRIETAFAGRLQSVATFASTYVLQTLGLPALAEGNVIVLPHGRIGVAEACSGLSMLTTFFALATAVALLIRRPWIDRALLLLSAAPIAVAANVARISATALAQEWVSPQAAHYLFHDLAGWLMMPLALALLWAELGLLSFLFAAAVVDGPMGVMPARPAANPPAARAGRPPRRKRKAAPPHPRAAGQA